MRNKFLLAAIIGGVVSAVSAGAAGFEKSVMWSGQYAGYGAAAESSVTGSQSLYFNPAGLAGPGDVSVNYSPSWLNADGNLVTLSRTDSSRPGMYSSGGAFASYGEGKYGIGVGAYAVGGAKFIYNSLNLQPDSNGSVTLLPSEETDLTLMEYALGGAMELLPGLKVGAAWRITHASGSLATVQKTVNNSAYSTLVVSNATDTNFGGFKLGALYRDPGKKWGVGASFRTQETFAATGGASGNTIAIANGAVSTNTLSTTVLGLVLPAEFSFGADYAVTKNVRLLGGLDYAQYSNDAQITVTGTSNGVALPNIPLNWNNMWNARLGLEYTGFYDFALRAGYVYTSQVTNTNNAKATFAPPGIGNLFTAGLGYTIQKSLELDGAFEYGHNSGTGMMTVPQPADQVKEILAGVTSTTTASSYAVHLGATYRF